MKFAEQSLGGARLFHAASSGAALWDEVKSRFKVTRGTFLSIARSSDAVSESRRFAGGTILAAFLNYLVSKRQPLWLVSI